MHQKRPFRTRKGDDGFSRGSAGARKGDRGFRQPAQLAYRVRLRRPLVKAGPGRASRRRTEQHQHTRPHWCGGRRRDRRARAGFETRHRAKRGCLVSRAAGASGAWNTSGTTSDTINEASRRPLAHRAPLVWRAPKGSAAVPVGAEGICRGAGGRRRDLPRYRWAAAGPGRGAGGRRRGLAGLRDDAPSEARSADGSRAGRRPPAHTAAGASGAQKTSGATRHLGITKPPGPTWAGRLSQFRKLSAESR